MLNNPLKYALKEVPLGCTDPSGHFFSFIIAAVISIIVAVVVDNPIIQMIATIAAAFFTGGAAAALGFLPAVGTFAAGFVGGALNSGTIEGAFLGGFTALLAFGIGHGAGGASPFAALGKTGIAVAHGIAQGAVSKLRGDSFRAGFAAGLVGHLAPTLNISGSGSTAIIARTLYAGLWGGLASTAAGGSFKDGAFQAAMVHLFNNEANNLELVFGGGTKLDTRGIFPNGKNAGLVAKLLNKYLSVTADTNGSMDVSLKTGATGSVSHDVINNTISGEINGVSFSMSNIEFYTPTPAGVGIGAGDYGLKGAVYVGPVEIYGTVSIKTNPGFWDFINNIGVIECRLGGAC